MKKLHVFLFVVILSGLVSACSPVEPFPAATEAPTVTATNTATAASTLTPTATPTLTPTMTYTATTTPTFTPTPTVEMISKENVDRLQLSSELFEREVFDFVSEVGFLHNGETFWISGIYKDDVVIRFYETASLPQLLEITHIARSYGDISVSPLGTQLVSTQPGGVIEFLSIPDGEIIQMLDTGLEWVGRIKWSPDGSMILCEGGTGDAAVFQIYSVEENVLLHNLVGNQEPISEFSWSPTGSQIASISSYNAAFPELLLWDVESGELFRTLKGHEKWIEEISWSPDGEWLASTNSEDLAYIWHGPTGGRSQVLKNNWGISEVTWSPDSTKYAFRDAHWNVFIKKTIGGGSIKQFSDFQGYPRSASWSPDGEKFIIVSDVVDVYSTEGWKLLPMTAELIENISAYYWKQDGSGLFLQNQDQLQYYDFESDTAQMLIDPELKTVQIFALHPEDGLLAFGTDGGLSVYADGQWYYQEPNTTTNINSLGWLPISRDLIYSQAYVPIVYRWDFSTGEFSESGIPDISYAWQTFYAWTPDEENLVTSTNDKIFLWDFAEMKIIRQIGAVDYGADIAIANDGSKLYAYDSIQSFHMWELETFKREEYIHVYELDDIEGGWINQVEVLPDDSVMSIVFSFMYDEDAGSFTPVLVFYRWIMGADGMSYEFAYELAGIEIPVVFSPDGSLFATKNGQVYCTVSGDLLAELPTRGIPAWTSDGKYLLIVNGSVEYWSVDGRQ